MLKEAVTTPHRPGGHQRQSAEDRESGLNNIKTFLDLKKVLRC